jgi:nucleotide-binding universal stress UspA family protein
MYKRILVPFDGSPTSRRGLEEAVKLAQLTKGRIKLMYIVDELALYMAAESDNFNGSVPELVTTEAATWPADVIVLGTHGRRGMGRVLMGSSAEKILRHATVPVLLKPADKPAPVEQDMPVKIRVPTAALHIE